MRGYLPDFLSILAANISIVASLLLLIHGLLLFAGQPSRVRYTAGLLLAAAIAFAWFTYGTPNLKARILLASGLIVLLSLWAIQIAYRQLPKVLPGRNWLLIGALGTLTIWHLLRVALVLGERQVAADFMKAGAMHGVTYLFASASIALVNVGLIVVNAQRLEQDLIAAKNEIKTLKGFLPICANCKKIRDDRGYWKQVEVYISQHADVKFTHGMCPDCITKLFPGLDETPG